MNPALLLLKGAISELPEEDQKEIKNLGDQILKIVHDNGGKGSLALAYAGLVVQGESEE